MGSREAHDLTRISARSSMIDPLKGCGLSGVRIDMEDLRKRISMPQYLRLSVRRAIDSEDISSATGTTGKEGAVESPESPMAVCVNPGSGGKHGPKLKNHIQQLMGEEHVSFCRAKN